MFHVKHFDDITDEKLARKAKTTLSNFKKTLKSYLSMICTRE